MTKILLVTALIVSCALGCFAQDVPKVDVFAGYSFVHSDPGFGLLGGDASGWEASLTYNWKDWVGLKADFDGHYCCAQTMHNFLFGPQFTLGRGKVSPFVHGLVGVSHGTSSGFSDNVLGFAAGAGLDLKVSDRLSVRLVQADYLGTHYADEIQNNFRLSAGVVFHFGRK